jgi:membrane protease subunit HflK
MTNNKQNPWGGGNNQTPPELDEVIRDFKNKFGNIFGGVPSKPGAPIVSKTPIFKYLFILALLVWLLNLILNSKLSVNHIFVFG